MALAGTYGGLRRDRTLPSRNRRNRSGTARGQSRGHGVAARVCGLALRTSLTPKRGTPPGGYPAARCWRTRRASSFDGIGALPVLALGGRYGQPHLLAHGPRQEPAHRMRLPARFLHQFLQRRPVLALQQVEDRAGFAAVPGTRSFLRALGCFLGRRGFFRRGGLLGRLALGGRDVAP